MTGQPPRECSTRSAVDQVQGLGGSTGTGSQERGRGWDWHQNVSAAWRADPFSYRWAYRIETGDVEARSRETGAARWA